MKLIIFIMTFLFLANVCHSQVNEQRQKWEYSKWPTLFRERALCLCLIEGYQDSIVRKRILQNDRSYYDPISIAIFDKTLIPIVRREVDSINIKFKNSIGRISEGAIGKKVFNHCMEFYKSKRLDLILKKARQEWKEIKDIDSEVEKSLPWF